MDGPRGQAYLNLNSSLTAAKPSLHPCSGVEHR